MAKNDAVSGREELGVPPTAGSRGEKDPAPRVRYCPVCGAANVYGAGAFCLTCGYSLPKRVEKEDDTATTTKDPGKKKKKKRTIVLCISLAAFVVIIALIVDIFLLGKKDTAKPAQEEPPVSEPSQKPQDEAPQLQQTEPVPTSGPADQEPAQQVLSFLCGDWYEYSGGKPDYEFGNMICAEVLEFHLAPTQGAEVEYYVTFSDVTASYTGEWTATVLSDDTAEIKFRLSGGFTVLEEGSAPSRDPFEITIKVKVQGNRMTVTAEDSDWLRLEGRVLIKDYLYRDWVNDQLSLGQPELTEEEVHSIFESFFFENFSANDMVCLADVTHDGTDDLLVIHESEEDSNYLERKVFVITEDRQVRQIYEEGSTKGYMGGSFNWYIRETEDGAILAFEDGFWSTGLGALTFREYYLSQDGEICDVAGISITSDDYDTEGELFDAFSEYEQCRDGMLSKMYTIYSCLYDGYDTRTIAQYPVSPYEHFSVVQPDRNAIQGHWTYHHELYGAVGIFAFEPDGTGYISVFDNVQYEYTYSVIGDTVILTLEDGYTICTFQRNGDEMTWEMSGQTYRLTYREGE